MAASGSSVIVTACTHGATNLGIVTNYQVNGDVTPLGVKGQGDQGNTAVGIVAKDFIAVVTFIAGAGAGPIATGTSATLSFVTSDLTGAGTKTYAITTMKALGFNLVHQDRSTSMYSQTFVHEGAIASTPFSIA